MVDMNGFDANTVDPSVGFEPIPKADYLAMCIDSEKKETKNSKNNGTDEHMLQLTWEVMDGEFKARRLWTRLNLWNNNATAVKIAQSELSAVCHATGIMTPKESAEFHNKMAVLTVEVESYKDKLSNVIKGYTKPGAESKGTTKPAAAKEEDDKEKKAPWAR